MQRIIYQIIRARFGSDWCLTFDPIELALVTVKKCIKPSPGRRRWDVLGGNRGGSGGREGFPMALGERRSGGQLCEHISPSSLRRISAETSGHRPR